MITVYGRENCVQCHYTTRFLGNHDIAFTYIDVDSGDVPDDMGTQLPYVVTPNASWSGYRHEKLKALAILHGKP